MSVDACIHKSKNHQHLMLTSMDADFSVDFVEHAAPNCVNPHFPSIHMYTQTRHSGWIQIIKTDQKGKYAHFIDSIEENNFFPFYSFEQDFFDAPLWNYGLFFKPISYWIAHAYAVEINKNNKTIAVKGGISWGFRLKKFRFRPEIILPQPLSKLAWKSDWAFLSQTMLEQYDFTTSSFEQFQ